MNDDEDAIVTAPPVVAVVPAKRRVPHDRAIQALTLLGGLPAVVVSFILLWSGDWAPKVEWTFSVLVVGVWLACIAAVRERVIYPMHTLTNLLAALREGDYSLRSRRARRDDALGEVMREINALGATLQDRRREAMEANALLRAVMSEVDVAVFTFDETDQLRLVNRAGAALLDVTGGGDGHTFVGQPAHDLALAGMLDGPSQRTVAADFPGRTGARWNLRRTEFRESGRPHRLLVLTDVSQSLREEERLAWQRLIRVLGHEINNSLGPIGSIADSLKTLVDLPPEQRANDWLTDTREGLDVIAGRAHALGRFMGSYASLAHLPAPQRSRQELATIVRRVAALETRLHIEVLAAPPLAADADGDQLEQALINLLRNATDAALETGGGVRATWAAEPGGSAAVLIEDDGPGLAATANLFVPFFTTKPAGSGIGLILTRQIAEAHGGRLTLENRTDGKSGCVATLRLPAWANPTR